MSSTLVFSFVGGLLVGGIGMILAVATLAEVLQRILSTDWTAAPEAADLSLAKETSNESATR